MQVGIATDHGGFALKQGLVDHLREAGHEVIDFGAHHLEPGDGYPDFVIPLAKAVAAGTVERGVAVFGSGVGASILIASGSEVSLAIGAHETLLAESIRSRVVSMPSWDIFESQSKEYRDSVLPPQVTARVAIEQASTLGWERYVGSMGRVIGMETFGASAPLKELQKKFGFEPDRVVETAKELLGKRDR
jgi:transketolase